MQGQFSSLLTLICGAHCDTPTVLIAGFSFLLGAIEAHAEVYGLLLMVPIGFFILLDVIAKPCSTMVIEPIIALVEQRYGLDLSDDQTLRAQIAAAIDGCNRGAATVQPPQCRRSAQ
jgi:hypothetical protein